MTQSPLLNSVPGILHGFGDITTPFPDAILAREIWEKTKPSWKQNHGRRVVSVQSTLQECGEADGLLTQKTKIPIAIVSADCTPILIARADGAVIAALHAGWRGTIARIVESFWAELPAQARSGADWVAAIGPTIGPCCYEVSAELQNQFLREFQNIPPQVVSPRPRHLDLASINRELLLGLGFKEVEKVGGCTRCSQDENGFLFHSYRREGAGTRQWSLIMKQGG